MGHVRDLPKSKLGVQVDKGFEPDYGIIPSRKKVMGEIREAAKGVTDIFIATDPDREGEAIGWHLAEELGGTKTKKIRRLMFNEITKKAIQGALYRTRWYITADGRSQQARRVALTGWSGYKISPCCCGEGPRGLEWARAVGGAASWCATASAPSRRSCPKSTGTCSPGCPARSLLNSDAKLVKFKGEKTSRSRTG